MTIANLTIRDVFYHPIILNAGVQSPLVHNVHLITPDAIGLSATMCFGISALRKVSWRGLPF